MKPAPDVFDRAGQRAVKFSPPRRLCRHCGGFGKNCHQRSGLRYKEDQLPHIFDRFYRSRSAQNAGGTGSGLAIAAGIARRHGMEITADNRTEGGAVLHSVCRLWQVGTGKCP